MIARTREAPPRACKPSGEAPKERKPPTRGRSHDTTAGAFCKQAKRPENDRGTALNQEATIVTIDPLLESTVKALNVLSPRSRELVALMVRQLAEQENITMAIGPAQGLQTPAEGIPLWVAKLKQESYSKQSIALYLMTVEGYLKRDPAPTRLSIQQWLAERLEHVSTARVSNDRKALRSLFSFLHEEGLWPIDPTAGIKHIRVRYRARDRETTILLRRSGWKVIRVWEHDLKELVKEPRK